MSVWPYHGSLKTSKVFLEVFALYVCVTIKAFVPLENLFFNFLLTAHFYHVSPVYSYFF